MPSIITHDTFGQELYAHLNATIGQSDDEKQAFLLGCQGPDVFFYGLVNPRIPQANRFAKKLHRCNTTDFLCALALCVPQIVEENRRLDPYEPSALDIARAYALGYLMHFELDSRVHPFVFSQTFAYCNAGVPGLNMSSQSEVHVEIECELDELVLTVKRGQTISTFDPSSEILKGTDRVLNIVGKLFEAAFAMSHGEHMPQNCFRLSVKAYRQTLRWLYSVTGVKRQLIGRFETLFRQHSYLRAMIHKNVKLTESIFDNHEHYPWVDPWVKNVSHTDSFWDLYVRALHDGERHIAAYAEILNSLEDAHVGTMSNTMFKTKLREVYATTLQLTEGKNFYGCEEKIADPETGRPA